MPYSSKKKSVAAPRRRRAVAPMRRQRRRLPANVPEWASHSENLSFKEVTTNTMYGPNTIGLDQFPRATQIAKCYQEYRITKVKVTFKPQFDTFAVTTNASAAIRVPNLYYMIDKAQSLPLNTTLGTLKAMGAKPHRFDDKNVVVQWSPGVQLSANTGALVAALTKPLISPWLNTNATPDATWTPSSVDHAGIFHYLEAGGLPGDGTYEYDVDVECQFQFRKPLLIVASTAPPALSWEVKPDPYVIVDVSGSAVSGSGE